MSSKVETKAEVFARILGSGGTFTEADKAWKSSPGYETQDRTNGIRDQFFAKIREGITRAEAEKFLDSQSSNVRKAKKNWLAIYDLAADVRKAASTPARKVA